MEKFLRDAIDRAEAIRLNHPHKKKEYAAAYGFLLASVRHYLSLKSQQQ